ncbi:MAG TPA: ABC transporter permease [Alphaproteobacteria bacterium]|nr:ABC transporter permease [Alphaproteobacteria bacterium]
MSSIPAAAADGAPPAAAAASRRRSWAGAAACLQAAPLTTVFVCFLVFPVVATVVVSFFDYDSVQIIPTFTLENYRELLFSRVTWDTYLNTFRFAALTWALTLLIGFTLSYFLAFHVRSAIWQIALSLLCTVPFWTSNVIRTISWIPFLGRNGLLNMALQRLGIIHQPLEFLLFSDFAVVLALVHLNTFFMMVPIFNSMMRIDRSLLEAARDAGASGAQILWNVVIPLSKTGIAIGSIFVVSLVMGDFVTVRVMSGGQSASVGLMMANSIGLLQYPAAAANAVLLLILVLTLIAAIVRTVDIRRELAPRTGGSDADA